jgi:hypothetical protein
VIPARVFENVLSIYADGSACGLNRFSKQPYATYRPSKAYRVARQRIRHQALPDVVVSGKNFCSGQIFPDFLRRNAMILLIHGTAWC